MKSFKILILFLCALGMFSCEEVIDVDLEQSEPRLVIEASIILVKGTDGKRQEIKLSKTGGFYDDELPAVTNASIRITAESGEDFPFSHTENGIYTNVEFEAIPGKTYELEIYYEEQYYIASETLQPVSSIDYIEQLDGGGFAGDEIEIKAYYTDPAEEQNFYLFKFRNDKPYLEIYEDEFTDGNQIFGYFSNEDIEEGDLISIQMEGISKNYYEYLFVLRAQTSTDGGGPFETMPAEVRGNIVNETNIENFPFGYFRLSEADYRSYRVE